MFFDFQTGLRFAASAVLIYSANMAFCDTKMYARKGFAPLLAALALLLVQSVYLVGRSAAQWALGVSASAVAAAVACGLDESRENGRLHLLVVMTAAAAALSAVQVEGFSPGSMTAAWLALLCAVGAPPANAAALGACAVCAPIWRGKRGSSVGGGMRQRRIGGFPAAAKTPRAAGRRLLPVRGGGAAGAGRGQAVDGAVSGGGGGCGLRAGAEKVAGHPAGYGGAASGCAGHGGKNRRRRAGGGLSRPV